MEEVGTSVANSLRSFANEALNLLKRQQEGRPWHMLVRRTWEYMLDEGSRLLDAVPDRRVVSRACSTDLVAMLKKVLRVGISLGNQRCALFSEDVAQSACEHESLNLGLGSPSNTGCVDLAGNLIVQALAYSETSIQAAFNVTGLHAIGLPGARLLPNAKILADVSYTIWAKGDGSFNSVAVAIRKQFLQHFALLESVGSKRRLWIHVCPVDGPQLIWLVFYLPPNDDVAWKEEVQGILQDVDALQCVFQDKGLPLPALLLTGDANFQPFILGKGRDPKPQRDATWQSLMIALRVALLNPTFQGEHEFSLSLPSRSKTVTILPCDTHHCNGGPGSSRAIDLICASDELIIQVCIHNGLHCKGLGCSWDCCVEFTKGDHFLIEVLCMDAKVSRATPACVALPRRWHEEVLWGHGISRATACLSALSGLFHEIVVHASTSLASNFHVHTLEQWVVDVCAWLLCVVESFIRDAWVLFAGVDRRVKRCRGPDLEQNLDCDNLDEICDALSKAEAIGTWPQNCVSTCLQWLRPPALQPPASLLVGDVFLSPAASHRAWTQQLHAQGQWPPHYDIDFHTYVKNHVKQLLGHARAHRGQGEHDEAFSLSDWFRASEAIARSGAPSPFLIPRLLLFMDTNAWQAAASKLQELCGPSCLALRPSLWRFRSLVVKYKKGAPSSPSSYRFLAVADLHGLVQEQLLLTRLAPQIHRSLEWFQTGYRFDVRNHHFTLSCLQSEYGHWKRSFVAIFADFVHAFPRCWRAALLKQSHDSVGLRDGALQLLGSIMEQDTWRITLSGDSITGTCEGIPEGSKYGPAAFNLLPDV